jgi:hypothetical protein
MTHDDPRQSRVMYRRIVRGTVICWSVEHGPWATHWLLLSMEA